MKRIRVLLLILLCLLPAGCSLRNRTDSAQFIPEHPETRQTETELQTTAAPETGAEYVDPAGRVKVLLNESGTFRYDAEPISYSYQIPMFDRGPRRRLQPGDRRPLRHPGPGFLGYYEDLPRARGGDGGLSEL